GSGGRPVGACSSSDVKLFGLTISGGRERGTWTGGGGAGFFGATVDSSGRPCLDGRSELGSTPSPPPPKILVNSPTLAFLLCLIRTGPKRLPPACLARPA